ncbi:MAG TPA: class I SAM-dependent methyltransferase, partial [Lamprocystis sp. (in: g-proteobacteria)]|nr:class I SAM-dependent methyltransferase [Lamprocystis sp. (in: g-proteobacteria)]
MSLVQWLDARLYPGVTRNWDDQLFRERILARLRPTDWVLDLGAGAGIVSAMDFRGRSGRLCGIDPDPRVADNPHLDEGRVGRGEAIPYPDDCFDLIFADNVLEHLEEPGLVFREVARVLKPGGRFLVKTPNAWHYMPVIARATPHRFHQWVNRHRGRIEADTFPTRYRANTPAALGRLATVAGLTVGSMELIE